MTNQPMLTHNCDFLHLVSKFFGGGELAMIPLTFNFAKSAEAGLILYGGRKGYVILTKLLCKLGNTFNGRKTYTNALTRLLR